MQGDISTVRLAGNGDRFTTDPPVVGIQFANSHYGVAGFFPSTSTSSQNRKNRVGSAEFDYYHQAKNSLRKTLLQQMNIELIEPEKTGTKSTCCGDSFYGVLSIEQVKEQMSKRAAEIPENEVVVYCVSCIKSMHIGGNQPRYLVDLLFGEETHAGCLSRRRGMRCWMSLLPLTDFAGLKGICCFVC